MYSQACQLQYKRLRATVSGVLVSGLRWCFLAAALVFWAYGLIGGQHWSTMVGVLFAIITAGSWQSATLMRHALQAFDSSLVQFGQVQISTRQWSDAVRYEAQVRVSDGHAWAFEFMPLGKPPRRGPPCRPAALPAGHGLARACVGGSGLACAALHPQADGAWGLTGPLCTVTLLAGWRG